MAAENAVWETHATTLRRWYVVYLACWLGGAVLLVSVLDMGRTTVADALAILGGILFGSSFVLYVVCMIYAYKVQSALNAAGLYDSGAWQIIVAAILLNPGCVGFYVPLSVLLTARRIRKKLASRDVE